MAVSTRTLERTQESTIETVLDVETVDGTGAARLRLTTARFRIALTDPNGKFDSAEQAGARPLPPEDRVFRELLPLLNFRCTISAQGEVREAAWDDESRERLRAHPAGSLLQRFFTEAAIVDMLKNQFPPLPMKPVRPGDSWKDNLLIHKSDGIEEKLERTFTYRGVVTHDGKEMARIDEDGALDPSAFIEAGRARGVKVEITSQQNRGVLFFDLERALPAYSEVSQETRSALSSQERSATQTQVNKSTVRVSEVK